PVDLADEVLGDAVRLDDRQSSFDGHSRPLMVWCTEEIAASGAASTLTSRLAGRGGKPGGSDADALAAAALAFHVRVADLDCLVEPLLHGVHCGAVDELEALAVHHDLHAAVLEHHVAFADRVGIVDHIRPAGAARALHSDAQ